MLVFKVYAKIVHPLITSLHSMIKNVWRKYGYIQIGRYSLSDVDKEIKLNSFEIHWFHFIPVQTLYPYLFILKFIHVNYTRSEIILLITIFNTIIKTSLVVFSWLLYESTITKCSKITTLQVINKNVCAEFNARVLSHGPHIAFVCFTGYYIYKEK